MTPEQRQNCEKLIAYLLKGELKAEFDMEHFDYIASCYTDRHNCGTVGCAIGHGPYAGVAKIERGWTAYCTRAFGISINTERRTWDYVFGSDWADHDNTPQGAARRLQEVLYGKTEFSFPWE